MNASLLALESSAASPPSRGAHRVGTTTLDPARYVRLEVPLSTTMPTGWAPFESGPAASVMDP